VKAFDPKKLNSEHAGGRHVERVEMSEPDVVEETTPMPAFDPKAAIADAPQRLKPIPKKQCTSDAWRSR
jgi:hypothetical protein